MLLEIEKVLEEKFSILVISDHDRETPTPAVTTEADHQLGLVLAGGLPGLAHQLRSGQSVQGYDLPLGSQLQGEEYEVSEVLTQPGEVSTLVSPLGHVANCGRELISADQRFFYSPTLKG